jgi:hypothetical protein
MRRLPSPNSPTLSNAGTITLNAIGHPNNSNLFVGASNLTLSGGGTISPWGTAPITYIYGSARQRQHLTNVDNTIQGAGNIGNGQHGAGQLGHH